MAALQVNVSKSRQAENCQGILLGTKQVGVLFFLMLASNIDICTYGIQLSEMGQALVWPSLIKREL